MPSSLSARIERLEGDDGSIVILRTCGTCGALVPGDPSLTPCAAHPPTPPPQPGERVIRIERSYGKPAPGTAEDGFLEP
jgi:hypothetical protein